MSKILIELEKETDVLKTVEKTLLNLREQAESVSEAKSHFIRDFGMNFIT